MSKSAEPRTDWIPNQGPWITDLEVEYVADAARSAWYERAGEWNARFERRFADWIGARFAISLPSCTAGLHLVMQGLDLGPGDEVVVPDATWMASAAPISYVGATPVFCDVDPRTWCLTRETLEAVTTDRTRAVVTVDLYGNVCDYDSIRTFADERSIVVIEDAAEAVGSRYKGRVAGGFGRAGVFSFHGSKLLTTGEGGMLVTDDETLYERCLALRIHGCLPSEAKLFWNRELGQKYKMAPIVAALGLAQLERIDELVERHREIFSWYAELLGDVPALTLNDPGPDVRSTYWMVTVVVDAELGVRSADIIRQLDQRGVDCRPFFHPLSSLPAYSGEPQAKAASERNLTAYAISPFGLNLPSAARLTREQVGRACEALLEVVGLP